MRLNFKDEFEKKISRKKIDYRVRGIITADRRVYPLGTDTKVLSSIFEAIARPIINEIANEHGLKLYEPTTQNCYPDFTLLRNHDDPKKIAVDIKTTYRVSEGDWKVSFTLGGYTSFIRPENSSKNIAFPYGEYAEEWVIGYIYKRKDAKETAKHIYKLSEINAIPLPYADVDVFVQEKWKIAGDVAGSGNTTNIGSISGSLDDFAEGRGKFQSKSEFLEYWRNYERTAAERAKKYSNIEEFREWRERAKNP